MRLVNPKSSLGRLSRWETSHVCCDLAPHMDCSLACMRVHTGAALCGTMPLLAHRGASRLGLHVPRGCAEPCMPMQELGWERQDYVVSTKVCPAEQDWKNGV